MWCWGLNSPATYRQAVYRRTCVLGLGNKGWVLWRKQQPLFWNWAEDLGHRCPRRELEVKGRRLPWISRGWPITKRNCKVTRIACCEKNSECGVPARVQSTSSDSECPWAKTAQLLNPWRRGSVSFYVFLCCHPHHSASFLKISSFLCVENVIFVCSL